MPKITITSSEKGSVTSVTEQEVTKDQLEAISQLFKDIEQNKKQTPDHVWKKYLKQKEKKAMFEFGDIVRYTGTGFEGFNTKNRAMKFHNNEGNTDAIVSYNGSAVLRKVPKSDLEPVELSHDVAELLRGYEPNLIKKNPMGRYYFLFPKPGGGEIKVYLKQKDVEEIKTLIEIE